MAREGVALALTYRSCIVEHDNAVYLRIGREGIPLDLGLAYPTGEYRSIATRELGRLFHSMYPGPEQNPGNLQPDQEKAVSF